VMLQSQILLKHRKNAEGFRFFKSSSPKAPPDTLG
jgi:hypothetical protein